MIEGMTAAGSKECPRIVPPRALAIHADPDAAGGQHLDELGRGELAALIRIEDFGCAVSGQGFLDGLDAEVRFQRDRYPPGQDAPAEPVDHGREIDEAPRHRE